MNDTDHTSGTPTVDASGTPTVDGTSSSDSVAIKAGVATSLLHTLQPSLDAGYVPQREHATLDALLARLWFSTMVGPNPQDENGLQMLVGWMVLHADRLPDDMILEIYNGLPVGGESDTKGHAAMRDELRRHVWDTHHALYAPPAMDPLVIDKARAGAFYRPRDEPAPYVLEAYGLPPLPSKRAGTDPRIAAIPDAFSGGTATVLSSASMRAPLQAIYDRPTAENAANEKGPWTATDDGWPYMRHTPRKGTISTDVYMRQPEDLPTSRVDAAELWALARGLDDLTGDVLLACIAQAVDYVDHGRRAEDGLVWIDADTILGYRGLKKKTGQDGYTTGYRPDERAEIAQRIGQLERMWVRLHGVKIIEQENGKKRRRPLPYREGRLLNVTQRIVQPALDGPDVPLAWGFTLTEPLKVFLTPDNRQTASIAAQALHYDTYHERWEKRLAIYLMINMRLDAKNGATFRREVGTLLEDTGLMGEMDRRNPERSRMRLHKALDRVCADAIAGGWEYASEGDLPARGWLTPWLGRVVVFREAAGSLSAEQHARIAANASDARQRGKARKARDAAREGGA